MSDEEKRQKEDKETKSSHPETKSSQLAAIYQQKTQECVWPLPANLVLPIESKGDRGPTTTVTVNMATINDSLNGSYPLSRGFSQFYEDAKRKVRVMWIDGNPAPDHLLQEMKNTIGELKLKSREPGTAVQQSQLQKTLNTKPFNFFYDSLGKDGTEGLFSLWQQDLFFSPTFLEPQVKTWVQKKESAEIPELEEEERQKIFFLQTQTITNAKIIDPKTGRLRITTVAYDPYLPNSKGKTYLGNKEDAFCMTVDKARGSHTATIALQTNNKPFAYHYLICFCKYRAEKLPPNSPVAPLYDEIIAAEDDSLLDSGLLTVLAKYPQAEPETIDYIIIAHHLLHKLKKFQQENDELEKQIHNLPAIQLALKNACDPFADLLAEKPSMAGLRVINAGMISDMARWKLKEDEKSKKASSSMDDEFFTSTVQFLTRERTARALLETKSTLKELKVEEEKDSSARLTTQINRQFDATINTELQQLTAQIDIAGNTFIVQSLTPEITRQLQRSQQLGRYIGQYRLKSPPTYSFEHDLNAVQRQLEHLDKLRDFLTASMKHANTLPKRQQLANLVRALEIQFIHVYRQIPQKPPTLDTEQYKAKMAAITKLSKEFNESPLISWLRSLEYSQRTNSAKPQDTKMQDQLSQLQKDQKEARNQLTFPPKGKALTSIINNHITSLSTQISTMMLEFDAHKNENLLSAAQILEPTILIELQRSHNTTFHYQRREALLTAIGIYLHHLGQSYQVLNNRRTLLPPQSRSASSPSNAPSTEDILTALDTEVAQMQSYIKSHFEPPQTLREAMLLWDQANDPDLNALLARDKTQKQTLKLELKTPKLPPRSSSLFGRLSTSRSQSSPPATGRHATHKRAPSSALPGSAPPTPTPTSSGTPPPSSASQSGMPQTGKK